MNSSNPLRTTLALVFCGALGTTNLALGRAGEVLHTGCLFVGARHIQVTPGTYRIVKLSSYARALLETGFETAAHAGSTLLTK